MLALVLTAVAMRFVDLGTAPLFDDEAVTAAFADLSWWELFTGVGLLEPNPPAFYGLEKLWIMVAGGSELALRTPAAIAGVMGVALVYRLVWSGFGSRAAFWTGLLLATNAELIAHARNARVYAVLFALTAASLIVVRRLVLSRSTAGSLGLALTGLLAALMCLHYTGVLIVVTVDAYALMLLLRTPGPRLRSGLALIASALAAAILNVPTFATMATIAADKANNAHVLPSDITTMTVSVLTIWASPGFPLQGFPLELGMMIFGFGLVVIGAGAGWALVTLRRQPETAALAAGAIAAVALFAGVSQITPILVDRTLLFSLALFLPLLGGALAVASASARALLGAVVLCAQLPALALAYAPARNGGQDWRALAADLKHEALATGWPVIVRHGVNVLAIEHYLTGGAGRPAVSLTPSKGARLSERMTRVMTAATPLDEEASPSELCSLVGAHGGALLIYTKFGRQEGATAEALLAAAGGHLDMNKHIGPIVLQRWPGTCSASG